MSSKKTIFIPIIVMLIIIFAFSVSAKAKTYNRSQKSKIFAEINRAAKQEKSYQVIFINDCSMSQARDICEDYARKYMPFSESFPQPGCVGTGRTAAISFSPSTIRNGKADSERNGKIIKKWLKACVKKGMSEKQKVLAIQKYMCKVMDYSNGSSVLNTVLRKRHANCDGYAKTFFAMCNGAGITSSKVVGKMNAYGKLLGHAWNRVKIGKAWYYIDVCWCEVRADKYTLTKKLWNDHRL